jgi:tetratricopeptide (TPR) repeat protein
MIAYSNLGNVALRAGDVSSAIELYKRGLALPVRDDESRAILENNLGIAVSRRGDLLGAMGHFRAAVGWNPAFVEVRVNLAQALAAQGSRAEAIDAVRSALRLNPAHAKARALLKKLELGSRL